MCGAGRGWYIERERVDEVAQWAFVFVDVVFGERGSFRGAWCVVVRVVCDVTMRSLWIKVVISFGDMKILLVIWLYNVC